MIRQDLTLMIANALTGVRALLLVLRWPVLAARHRDRGPAVQALVVRQQRIDALALGPAEPAALPPVRPVPWLLCQAALGPGVLALSLLMWAVAAVAVSTPLWWRWVSEHPLPGVVATIGSTGNAFIVTLLGLLMAVIAAAGSHGLPRWHAGVNRLLSGGRRRSLTRRIAVLTESRAGALELQAAELRRIERDLHDGAQARLVSLSMVLGLLDFKLRAVPPETRQLVAQARGEVGEALRELRELVRGVYPPILADRGLAGGIESLAEHAGSFLGRIRVTVEVAERLPVALESTVYFVVAEALTNVSKHSGADRVEVTVRGDGRRVRIEVVDDGRGGADERHGSGLAGLRRRVAAFDGELTLASPVGGPTVVHVELPCAS